MPCGRRLPVPARRSPDQPLPRPLSGRCLAPCQVGGRGQLARTDAIDADVLAGIAAIDRPAARAAPSETALRISEMSTARRGMVAARAKAQTQGAMAQTELVQSLCRRLAADLTEAIEALEAELDRLIDAEATTRRMAEILVSIPGIGAVTARTLIADLPEIGRMDAKEVAAMTGTAPYARSSGQWRGKARTKGGRQDLRSALYMPALTAMTRNPGIKAFADRLRAAGKPGRVIVIAVIRKLVILANTLVHQNRTWTKTAP